MSPGHSWKGYLLHAGTIVLGLLIAIGPWNRAWRQSIMPRERQELRESLRRDAEKAVVDAQSSENTEKPPLIWLSARRQQVKDALATSVLAGPLPGRRMSPPICHIDPAWGRRQGGGQLLCSQQEGPSVFGGGQTLRSCPWQSCSQGVAASEALVGFSEVFHYADPEEHGCHGLVCTHLPISSHCLDLLIDEDNAWDRHRVLCKYVRGGETAILAGERDLGHVQKAELSSIPARFVEGRS